MKYMPKKRTSATSQKSVQNAIKNLERFARDLNSIPVEEFQKSAQIIKEKAIAKTPYKTGKLEHSVYVIVSKNKKRPGLRAGASARSPQGYNYAGIQHENEEFNHPIKGEAHFISNPFEEEVTDLKRRLTEELKVSK